jgi:hypothetical protein
VDPAGLTGTLTFAKLGGTPGDEKLTFTGSVALPVGTPPVLDPLAQGMQILVDQAGATPVVFLRLTAATSPIPPGARGTGCGAKDGWKKTTYANASGALPPDCVSGSAHGLRSVKVKDRRAKGGGVAVTVKVPAATLPAPTAGVRVTLVFGASPEAGAAGFCAVRELDCATKKAKTTCR